MLFLIKDNYFFLIDKKLVLQSNERTLKSVSFLQRKMNERRMAALKQDTSESDSDDGATTYRSLAGM